MLCFEALSCPRVQDKAIEGFEAIIAADSDLAWHFLTWHGGCQEHSAAPSMFQPVVIPRHTSAVPAGVLARLLAKCG